MKVIFNILLLSLSFSTACYSQTNNDNENHSLKGDIDYVYLAVGRSVPMGDFASKDMSNRNSGFANAGYKIEINAGYHLVENLYANAKCFYSSYNCDASVFMNFFQKQNPEMTWRSNGMNWNLAGLMIGPAYIFNVSEHFTLEAKLLGGIMQSRSTGLTLTASDGSTFTEDDKSALSFVNTISIGGIYPVKKAFNISGNIEYVNADPNFENVNTTIKTSKSVSTVNSTIHQHINLLSFNLGVLFIF